MGKHRLILFFGVMCSSGGVYFMSIAVEGTIERTGLFVVGAFLYALTCGLAYLDGRLERK